MEQFSFVFTIFIVLLGPIKLIPAFAGVVGSSDEKFSRALAIYSFLIASAIVAFVALAGRIFLVSYRISYDSLRIAGGLVLLVAAFNTIFSKAQTQPASSGNVSALKLAASPMAIPIIVPPAGVAAILIFMMLAPDYPGMEQSVSIALPIVMVLDFLVMFFNRAITKIPGFMMVLQLFIAVLVFMQVGLAIETMLDAFKSLGWIKT